MHQLYNIGIFLYTFLLSIASLFHSKAAKWLKGRRGWQQKLQAWRKVNTGKLVWVHCASLGEFEQGRPLIEALKRKKPGLKILLTFFSPSGYEVRHNYSNADFVCYLPADTPKNAKRFVEIIAPDVVIFVKYEYWANYFLALKRTNAPLFMVSAIFRKDQRFFGWQKNFWIKILSCVHHFFLQNQESEDLLGSLGFTNHTLSGDTRFDRVAEIAATSTLHPQIEEFIGDKFCIILGSSYPFEEQMASEFMQTHHSSCKLIVAPHEISQNRIQSIRALFPDALSLTELERSNAGTKDVLIVDRIGILSSLYRSVDVAIIGGGHGKGIHNVLEAAVFGIPILFGPNYQSFYEAVKLIECGAATACLDSKDYTLALKKILQNELLRRQSGEKAKKFVESGTGATEIVMQRVLQELA